MKEIKEIKKLDTWDMSDTVCKPDGYDMTTIPDATSNNMLIYMEKINELTDVLNELTKAYNSLTNPTHL
jgi:hypothetical protein